MRGMETTYDAALRLLDRQVVDPDGLKVCKVDDLELTPDEGGLRATAVLSGAAALLPRLSGPLGARVLDFWERMGDEHADRELPYRIGFEAIDEVDSAVHINLTRRNALVRTEPDQRMHRLGQLLRLRVRTSEGHELGGVLDVRLDREHRVVGLIVGPGRPGSLLGYDRDRRQGPALVRVVVRRLHRHVRYVRWEQAGTPDWERSVIVVAGEPERPERAGDR